MLGARGARLWCRSPCGSRTIRTPFRARRHSPRKTPDSTSALYSRSRRSPEYADPQTGHRGPSFGPSGVCVVRARQYWQQARSRTPSGSIHVHSGQYRNGLPCTSLIVQSSGSMVWLMLGPFAAVTGGCTRGAHRGTRRRGPNFLNPPHLEEPSPEANVPEAPLGAPPWGGVFAVQSVGYLSERPTFPLVSGLPLGQKRAPCRLLHDRQKTMSGPCGSPPRAIGGTWPAVRSVALCGGRPMPGHQYPFEATCSVTASARRSCSPLSLVTLVGVVRRRCRSRSLACVGHQAAGWMRGHPGSPHTRLLARATAAQSSAMRARNLVDAHSTRPSRCESGTSPSRGME